jgi:ureidoglycolate dehydrogenase (NAD+)
MIVVMPDQLQALVTGIFRKHGVSQRDSEIVAACLVRADLRGVESHGVFRVPHYVKRLDIGSINPTPNPIITRTGPAAASMNGDNGLGHVAMWDAMGLAMDLAREAGVGFVGVNHSTHCGMLSFFTGRALESGLIGLAFSQTDMAVVPYGARKPFCGTNPLSVGIPSESGAPITLDMATSTVAGGQIFKARANNRPIPDTWALDSDGSPTTDPHRAVYFTPAAGAKGYGLGVIVDVLTGILSGGGFGPHVPPMYDGLDKKRGLCHLVGAIDFRRFAGAETFLPRVSRMIEEIHEVPPAEGFQRVLAPGEPEYLKEIERTQYGIPLEDYLWNDLVNLAGEGAQTPA